MNHALDLFNEIFYSVEPWGYFGVILLLMIGMLIVREEKRYGVYWYIILLIICFNTYMTNALFLDHVWKVFILIFGGFLICIVPNWK